MATLIDTREHGWTEVRPDLTSGVTGKLLHDGAIKVVLTKVVPGGGFHLHQDSYGHLLHVLAGQALARVDTCEFRLSAGMSLQIEPGESHGYENCGAEELLLISMNLP